MALSTQFFRPVWNIGSSQATGFISRTINPLSMMFQRTMGEQSLRWSHINSAPHKGYIVVSAEVAHALRESRLDYEWKERMEKCRKEFQEEREAKRSGYINGLIACLGIFGGGKIADHLKSKTEET